MFTFFKLIRLPNLLFIILTQWLMRQIVIVPILQVFGFDASISTWVLWLLIFSTVCIAAGGYILNDYFDMKIDAINRPDSRIVGNIISRQATMKLYQVVTAIGLASGITLAILISSLTIAFLFIIITGLLWFYSASYKRQFVVGNLVVAFLASMSVLIVGITELALLEKVYSKLIFETPIPSQIYSWIGGFAFFAFLCTWIREIIKDIEDVEGDRELESRTMPVKWGVARTKIAVYALITITIALLYIGIFSNNSICNSLTIKYISFGIVLPYVVLIYLIATSTQAREYHQAATLSKFIMLVGVLYSFLFYYQLAQSLKIPIFNTFIVK